MAALAGSSCPAGQSSGQSCFAVSHFWKWRRQSCSVSSSIFVKYYTGRLLSSQTVHFGWRENVTILGETSLNFKLTPNSHHLHHRFKLLWRDRLPALLEVEHTCYYYHLEMEHQGAQIVVEKLCSWATSVVGILSEGGTRHTRGGINTGHQSIRALSHTFILFTFSY